MDVVHHSPKYFSNFSFFTTFEVVPHTILFRFSPAAVSLGGCACGGPGGWSVGLLHINEEVLSSRGHVRRRARHCGTTVDNGRHLVSMCNNLKDAVVEVDRSEGGVMDDLIMFAGQT